MTVVYVVHCLISKAHLIVGFFVFCGINLSPIIKGIKMSLRTLEIELNRLYDEIVARDDFVNLRAEQKKIEKLFLSNADKHFGVSYSMSGYLFRYSYYSQNNLFAEIDLWECPNFEDREEFIKWFVDQIRIGRQNLQLTD